MTAFFDWIPADTFSEEVRLAKQAELMSKRAKRKLLNERVRALMEQIQQIEIERSNLCDAEERLEDELARRKK